MRAIVTITKNLKLLLRSRETAYTIIAGPLLIILLVSFAFLGSSDDYEINVGVYAPSDAPLGERTVAALNERGYRVFVYPDEETCIDRVRTAEVHTCLAFASAQPGIDVAPVRFHVDESRMNLVAEIVTDLSDVLEGQADDIRRDLAISAALRIESAAGLLDTASNATDEAAAQVDGAIVALSTATGAIDNLPNETGNITDLRQLRGYQQGLASNVKVATRDSDVAIEDAIEMIRDLTTECGAECPEGLVADADDLEDSLRETQRKLHLLEQETLETQLFEANLLLEYAVEDVERISAAIGNGSLAGATIGASVQDATGRLDMSARTLRLASARLSYARDVLRGEQIDADTLANPVSTTVMSVTAQDDRLSFAYPYLLILVIMFIGMLLASTLIVTDKTSRAAFRTFTTPIGDAEGTFLAFVTGALLLAIETGAILIISTLFIAQPLLTDPSSTLVILAIAILLFTAIGMIIGYLSRSQEAAMIACLSIGSVLLFVSNLVIPVEGLALVSRTISAANPYIALSELLKRSMLYGVSFRTVVQELLGVIVALAILLLVAAWIQRSLKRRYFRQDAGLLAAQHVPAPLRIGEQTVHNAAELMDALDRMTRVEFERFVTADDNAIVRWAHDELREPRLARGLRTRSKEKMILWIDTWLKKHGKRITS